MTTAFSHVGLVHREDAQDPAETSQLPNSATIAEPLLGARAELPSLPDTATITQPLVGSHAEIPQLPVLSDATTIVKPTCMAVLRA